MYNVLRYLSKLLELSIVFFSFTKLFYNVFVFIVSFPLQNQLSGYLLRKFKSSNGWQRLWVVFTSFCLFFYKSCQDDFPLASLPLLGYTVGAPAPEDGIAKDYVFKLQYKNHVYFFRSDSEYTYNR